MSNDFYIHIEPGDGEQLRVVVRREGDPMLPDGVPFTRPPFSLSQETGDTLRRGNAPKQLVAKVTADVSQWLLGEDISAILNGALAQPDSKNRFVFSLDNDVRAAFDDLPFELLRTSGGGSPLAVHPHVSSIVHRLTKLGNPPTARASSDWPLRVLIVRSNPLDLGGQVPAAGEIRKAILASNPHAAADVEVDILSREEVEGVVGLPTREGFADRIGLPGLVAYDVLAYLGHGEVLSAHEELTALGVLQFENDAGDAHDPVPADKLAARLRSVPLVLLIGCLTAAEVPKEIIDVMPDWLRGSQGVAQSLVNSGESGVRCAIGMRYRLESSDAKRFVEAFFKSLLKLTPGNVESAVHFARSELHFKSQLPLSWSAPVTFQTAIEEPMFAFLTTPPTAVCATQEQHGHMRAIFWDALSKHGPEAAIGVRNILQQVETKYIDSVLSNASLIMPVLVESQPAAQVELPLHLFGQESLDVDVLEGQLLVSGADLAIGDVKPTPQLTDNGYELFVSKDSGRVKFRIKRNGDAGAIPCGELARVRLDLGPAGPGAYPVAVQSLDAKPPSPVCPGTNAVIVQTPASDALPEEPPVP